MIAQKAPANMLLCADDSDLAPFSVGDLAFNAGYTAPFVHKCTQMRKALFGEEQ